MLELIFLIVSIGLLLCYVYMNSGAEPFENEYNLQSCPGGYNTFYHTNGNIGCCKGEVKSNMCVGYDECTLSESGNGDIPLCVTQLIERYKAKSKDECPPSMKSYYEDMSKNIKGCTAGSLNKTLNGPKFNSQGVCKIYNTGDENMHYVDSCFNVRIKDEFECFGDACVKTIVKGRGSTMAPALLAIDFTDASGMRRTAYSRDSYRRYLSVVNPNNSVDLNRSLNIAEVARAYYIDKTLEIKDVTP
jgi:hypothetical protein